MADWPSDKELEEIYRKGSEKHDFEYDPLAWDAMAALLDRKRKRKFLFFFLGSLIVGMIAATSFFQFRSTKGATAAAPFIIESAKTIQNTPLAATQKSSNTQKSNDQQRDIDNNQVSSYALHTEKNISTSSLETKQASKTSTLQGQNAAQSLTSNQETSYLKESVSGENIREASLHAEATSNESLVKAENQSGLPNNEQTTLNSDGLSSNSFINKGEKEIASQLIFVPQASYLIRALAIPEFSVLPIDNIKILENSNETNNHFSKFLILAELGAESSWTTNGEFSSIDFNIGLRGSLFLSKKFAISIGGNFIHDLYVADKGDYKMIQGFFPTEDGPLFTAADNSMIELTTGLSYYMHGINQNGLGLHINLLSNFMLNESYDYHFEESAHDFSSSWITENNTWLNGISISPVYKTGFGKKGAIEIGPYIKVPLAGIGHGDIMLSSFGLKVGIGFQN